MKKAAACAVIPFRPSFSVVKGYTDKSVMSRKKADKSSYPIFASTFSGLVERNGGRNAVAEDLGVTYDTVRRWCNGEGLPEGKLLMAIHEKYDVSIDYLLTGSDPAVLFMDAWPKEIREECVNLHEILASGDPVVVPAIKSNITAFLTSIRKTQHLQPDMERINKRMAAMEEALSDIKDALGNDAAPDVPAGERRAYNREVIPKIKNALKKIA